MKKKMIRKRKPTKPLRSPSQVIHDTETRRKLSKKNDELEVKPYPKTKKKIKQEVEKPKLGAEYLSCKRRSRIDFNKTYYCKNCQYIIIKQKHQIDKKKVLRQDKNFSSRLPYANTKIRVL